MTPSEQSYPETPVRYVQIPALGGHYFVGSDGSIFRLYELKPGLNRKRTHAYYTVQMFDEFGRKYYATIHSIVARAFIGPRPKGMFIDHIDGNTFNNDAKNLEYVTPAENTRRAYASGRRTINHAALKKCADLARGRRSEKRRFTDEQAYEIIAQYKSGKYSMKALGDKYGCCASNIHKIVHGDEIYREIKRVTAPSVRESEKKRGVID